MREQSGNSNGSYLFPALTLHTSTYPPSPLFPLTRHIDTEEVDGSSPFGPTIVFNRLANSRSKVPIHNSSTRCESLNRSRQIQGLQVTALCGLRLVPIRLGVKVESRFDRLRNLQDLLGRTSRRLILEWRLRCLFPALLSFFDVEVCYFRLAWPGSLKDH